ncbi:MAG: hypothetical protein EBU62_12940 [Proteobacteria bacterium]|nr:hypothetical protein [Pseudomonadota bacterium]
MGPLSGLTGHERVAAFLIAVGEEAATAILKNMPEDDVERIALEIHKQRYLSADVADAILDEVAEQLGGDEGGVAGGLPFLRHVLNKTLLPNRANEMLSRLTTSPPPHQPRSGKPQPAHDRSSRKADQSASRSLKGPAVRVTLLSLMSLPCLCLGVVACEFECRVRGFRFGVADRTWNRTADARHSGWRSTSLMTGHCHG